MAEDSLFEEDVTWDRHPLSQIARVSLNGQVYYLNPNFPLRKREKLASERQKWAGEERWTVGRYLMLIALDAMGMIH